MAKENLKLKNKVKSGLNAEPVDSTVASKATGEINGVDSGIPSYIRYESLCCRDQDSPKNAQLSKRQYPGLLYRSIGRQSLDTETLFASSNGNMSTWG